MNQAALASLARPSSRSLLLGPCARQGRLVLLAQGRPTGQPTGKPQRCLEFACISSRCHVCVYARASVCVEGGRGVAASSDRGPRGPRPAGAAPETAPRHPARSAWSAAAPSVSRAAAGAVPVASGGRSRAGLRRSRRSLRRSLPTKRGRGAEAGRAGTGFGPLRLALRCCSNQRSLSEFQHTQHQPLDLTSLGEAEPRSQQALLRRRETPRETDRRRTTRSVRDGAALRSAAPFCGARRRAGVREFPDRSTQRRPSFPPHQRSRAHAHTL